MIPEAPVPPSSAESAAFSRVSQGHTSEAGHETETASEYHSFSDSDSEGGDEADIMTEEERKLEREMRAVERQLVLEAAGIVVKKDSTRRPPPHLQRRRGVGPVRSKHRSTLPAPPSPPSAAAGAPSQGQAGPDPDESPQPRAHARFDLDDAYERYEAFKQHEHATRSSITSIEQLAPSLSASSSQSHESPPPPVPEKDRDRGGLKESNSGSSSSVSALPSYGSRITQLLARSRSPAQEREGRIMPTISAPIISASSSGTGINGTPAREDSPGFGLVSWGLF